MNRSFLDQFLKEQSCLTKKIGEHYIFLVKQREMRLGLKKKETA